MTSRVYGTAFRLPKASLEEVADAVWAWAFGREAPAPGPWQEAELSVGPRRIRAESAAEGGLRVRRLTLNHPDAREAGTAWQAGIDMIDAGGGTSVGLLLERDSGETAGEIPDRARSVPRIVRDLIGKGAWNGHQKLSEEIEVVTGAESVEEFVEGALLDPNRRVPIVLVTARAEGGFALEVGAYEEFARGLAGVALVYAIPDSSDTYRLSHRVGRRFSAWHGAVRLYRPELRLDGNAYDHPLILANRLSVWSLRWLRRQLVSQAAEQYVGNPAVSAALTRRRAALEREQLEARAKWA